MAKEANITIILVPEADKMSNRMLIRNIKKTLRCNSLLKVKKVKVAVLKKPYYCVHHRMPDGKEVRIHG